MDRFICDENIARYRKLLADPNVGNDKVRHAELLRQLAAENAKGRDTAREKTEKPFLKPSPDDSARGFSRGNPGSPDVKYPKAPETDAAPLNRLPGPE